MRHKRGFTLAELLIVVAIIGVLAAVAIPVFTSSLEKTKYTVCIANQTSAQHVIIMSELVSGTMAVDDAKKLVAGSVGQLDQLCPDHKTYIFGTAMDGSERILITCPEHGGTPPQVVGGNIEDLMKSGGTLRTALDNYFSTHSGSNLDSSGPNFGGDVKSKIAKQLGISDQFDFKVMKNTDGAAYVIYIFDGIDSDNKAGDTIHATRYYLDKDGTQVKEAEAGSGQLISATVDDKNGKPVTFCKLDEKTFQAVK